MRAGDLRYRVQIQEAVETQADTGELTTAWTAVASAWASIEPLAGREYLLSQQAQASATHTIRLRVIPRLSLTVKHRILFGERVFDINSVADVRERGAEWELRCTEAAN